MNAAIPMKHRTNLLLTGAALLLLALLALPFGATALAEEDEDALHDAEVVAVESDTAADAETLVTYKANVGDYLIVLNGVTDANKENLANAIAQNMSKGAPIKFTNASFVDADKYSTAYDGFDKYHCWLGSTSNILTITGWAGNYQNPLTNEAFADEDDLLVFLSSSMNEGTGLPDNAYSYFFDGLFGGSRNANLRTTERTSLKPFAGTSHKGFDPDLCSAAIAKRVTLEGNLSVLDELEGLQEHGLEMSITGDTSHSITVVGAVIDESLEGPERYKAVLLADTDNETPSSEQAPNSFQEANEAKCAKENSYTLYHLELTEDYAGPAMLVKDYLKYKPTTLIGSFTEVAFYSDQTREAARETSPHATRNASTTADITLTSLSLFNSSYEEKDTYTTSDNLTLQAIIMSINADVPFNKANTGHQNLENRVEIYRDGTLVETVDEPAWLSLENGIDGARGEWLNIDLSSCSSLRVPGNYTLTFCLNTGEIDEAYVMNNNAPRSISITVVEDESGKTDPDPEDDPSDEAPSEDNPAGDTPQKDDAAKDDTSTDQGANNAKLAQAMAATGDDAAPILTLALVAAILLGVALWAWTLSSPASRR